MSGWLIRSLEARDLVPRISATERTALEAGTVWIEGALFSGRPDFRRLLAEPYPSLNLEEQGFLDGPVEEVCRMVDPWQLSVSRELPADVWDYLKEHRFFGLTIPSEYGGLGFSALGASAVFGKLATRSLTLSAVVLIPNSVGPGELLLHYGTREQQDHYLPRLARGEEIPCFALTEPEAGSDAASLRAEGVVFRAPEGQLSIRLDWEKRYITLAPVATLLGLAFRLRDPDNLLGQGSAPGITFALVSTSLPGVEVGRHHDIMGLALPNGPTTGRDVEIPLERIIGGAAGAGRGWQMLMEALAGGRAVSLPAQSAAGAKAASRIAGAYAAVRRQFGQPIGRFEGIQEPLARLAGWTYLMEAARVFTCGAVDRGHKPAVASALVKHYETELARRIVNDTMDILGGAGLCRGPRSLLGEAYASVPVGITVEGANILTRTLIAFGQGTIRCHPYLQREIRAMATGDQATLRRALMAHAWHLLRNLGRATRLSLSRGRLSRSPVRGPTARYYRRLAWAAASFAVLADVAILTQGARLKARGALSGRLADILAWIYLGFAALRRFEAEGRRSEDLPLVHWTLQDALARIQGAFDGVLRNLDTPLVGLLLRGPVAWWSRFNPLGVPPGDRLTARVARLLRQPGPQRDRLTAGVYQPTDADDPRQGLERALELAWRAAPLLARVRQASRRDELGAAPAEDLVDEAVRVSVLTPEEGEVVRQAELARDRVIRVDSFLPEEYRRAVSAWGQRPGVPTTV